MADKTAASGPAPRLTVAVFAIALAVRAAFVLAQARWSLFFGGDLQGPDTRLYRELAHSLAAGMGMWAPGPVGWKELGYPFQVGPTAWVMPGYPLLLAAVERVFGASTIAIKLVQCVVGALACVFVMKTAWTLFGRSAGIVAAAIAALYYELVFNVASLMSEPLYTCAVAWMLWALVDATRKTEHRGRSFAAAGIVFGLATLVRPQVLAAAVALAGLLAIEGVRSDRRRLAHAALFMAACVIVLVPWAVRNQRAVGRFTFVSTESGYVLWLGNNPAYDRIAIDFTRFGGYSPAAAIPPLEAARGRREIDVDRLYTAAAVSHISAHPAAWLARIPHKLWNMWRPAEVTSSERHRVIAWTVYPALLALTAFGLIAARDIPESRPLVLFLATNVAMHALVTGELRFRIPLWPAIIPFASLAIVRMCRRQTSGA